MGWLRGLLMNQDGGAAGGGNGDAGQAGAGQQQQQFGDQGQQGAGQQGNQGQAAEAGTDGGQEGAAAGVTGSLEGDGGVTFTPEQKAAIAKMISGRVNDVKKQYEGSEVYKQAVEMIGDIIGSKDVNVISQHLKTLHAQHQAKQMGMTPQGYQAYQNQQQQTQQQLNETKKVLAGQQVDQMKSDPKYADADLYRDQIIDLSVQSGLSVQQAYWAVAGEMAAQRLSASAASDAEHRTMNNITNNRTKQVQGGDSGGQNGGPKVTPEIQAAAMKVGMDPVEYMKYSGITSIDEARALRPKQ